MIRNCQDLTELITDYLEGSLGPVDRLLFRIHLRGCPSCRAYLAQMRATIRAADAVEPPPIPPEVRDEMLRRFRDWSGPGDAPPRPAGDGRPSPPGRVPD